MGLFKGQFQSSAGPDSEKLETEVSQNICDLVVQSQKKSWSAPLEEQVLRVVSLVVLRLQRQDGRVLAQTGHLWRDPDRPSGLMFKPGFKLPGEKIQSLELPSLALDRLLTTSLAGMRHVIHIEGKDVQENEQQSASYKIRSKYIRHVHSGLVDPSWDTQCQRYALVWPQAGTMGWHLHRHHENVTSLIPDAFVLQNDLHDGPPVFAWVRSADLGRAELVEDLEQLISSAEVDLWPTP